jgi:hypothetical protein
VLENSLISLPSQTALADHTDSRLGG